MQPTEFRADLDVTSLLGETVDAYAQDNGYWHLFVALRLAGSKSLVFTTEEHSAGQRFEVFPIRAKREVEASYSWRTLDRPILVSAIVPLWRYEWLEAGAVGETVGTDPATHYAGRGPASPDAIVSARVLAGVFLEGAAGEQMVVAASDSAPFNVEVFLSAQAAKALDCFEPVCPNPSLQRTAFGGR